MSKTKVYLIIQTVLCVLLVVILSWSVIDMYRAGVERAQTDVMAWYFTREMAAERFRPIAPLFFAAVGFGLAGVCLAIKDEKQDKPAKEVRILRDLTAARVAQPSEAMRKERALQKRLGVAGWGGFVICMIPIAVYVADGAHFPQGDVQLEHMIAGLAAVLIPFAILGIACLAICSILQDKSMVRETEAAKVKLQEEKAAGIPPEKAEPPRAEPGKRRILQLVLILAAVLFICAGIFNGSARDVLMKAIKICTECVGLG